METDKAVYRNSRYVNKNGEPQFCFYFILTELIWIRLGVADPGEVVPDPYSTRIRPNEVEMLIPYNNFARIIV